MSELPKTKLNTDIIPVDKRYADAFGTLPLQSTLNMLLAFQPRDNNEKSVNLRIAMEAVYSGLLVTSQKSPGHQPDLDVIAGPVLEQVADYLWEQDEMQDYDAYRPQKSGAKVIDIVRHQTA